MNKYVTMGPQSAAGLAKGWDDPESQGNVWFSWKCVFPADSSPDPAGPSVERTATQAQLKRAGMAHWWDTYLWYANAEFPDADLTFKCDKYTERVMVFLYRGKWAGMHSAMP